MIVFEMKYTMHSFQEKWKSYVSASDPSHDITNCYIRYFPKLRSPTWMSLHVFLPTYFVINFIHMLITCFWIIYVYVRIRNKIYMHICALLFFFFNTQKKKVDHRFSCIIPKYKDYFGVHEEAVAVIKFGLTGIAIYFFVFVVFGRYMSMFMQALVFTVSCFGVVFSVVMTSTWWVLRRQYSSIETYLHKAKVRIMGLFIRQQTNLTLTSSSPSSHATPRLSDAPLSDLSNILKDAKGFDLFMEHLFSGSFLFCFVV
ncbi:hypothetical protein RFI_20389 [Reticulomyxa filosa]|uniref:Uncharacterized protein n=1 Tax=Reticulomyxa filosa TaxID=46433 RepID=X6MT06_RETFI|nr:hypothetical protein RFI_20389 [Reticulomyxa filosa]|eukprot:ETO16949.1 hypothetical protein RFI_20389 [Reticulomyxa filosa]